jgi:transcriptional regulator with XRE-family HTH domain
MPISKQEINLIMASKLFILCRQADIKPHQMAKALDISKRTFTQLENGLRPFSQKNINDICNFFKIKSSDFIKKPTKTSLSKYPPYMDEVMVALVGELKSIREERHFYMQNLDIVIKSQLALIR